MSLNEIDMMHVERHGLEHFKELLISFTKESICYLPIIRKGEAVLRWIAVNDGLRYGEITRFVCEMNGRNYDEFENVTVLEKSNGHRWNFFNLYEDYRCSKKLSHSYYYIINNLIVIFI